MAGLALRRDMTSPQRVLRVQVMIEHDSLPIARCVAGLAFLSVGSFVLVVLLVAGIAVHRSVSKGRCQVAFCTFHLGMLSHQWEPRLVMVERRFFP